MESLKGSGEALPEKVFSPDECGDSLWEEILSQDYSRLAVIADGEKDNDTIYQVRKINKRSIDNSS